jgi:hypothetical protein
MQMHVVSAIKDEQNHESKTKEPKHSFFQKQNIDMNFSTIKTEG